MEDAKLLKARITELKIDYCYSSPIERAKATSEILFDHVLVDERLKEMNFGKYEGCLINELLNEPIYNRLWNLPDDDVTPGGETYHEVQMRLKDFLMIFIKNIMMIQFYYDSWDVIYYSSRNNA
ncbi:MAG: histidine phosphatase family protein [Coprobacillus cateniformis]